MGLMDWVARVPLLRRPEPVDTLARLESFVDGRASFIAQKCVVEFCRVRAGVYWQKLFDEALFREKLAQSCWESYAPALSMVLEVVDAQLREPAGLRQRELPDALAALGGRLIAGYDTPQDAPEDFWPTQLKIVEERMAQLKGQPAREARHMAKPMARRIFDKLPIHKDIVQYDYDYIHNNLRMNLMRMHDDFLKLANGRALAAELLGPQPRD